MSNKNKIITLFAVLGGLIVIAGLGGLLVYGVYFKLNDAWPTRVAARAFNLPAAKVGPRAVSYSEFLSTRDAIKKFIGSEAGKQVDAAMPPDDVLNKNILERLIRQELTQTLADQKKIAVTEAEVEEIFKDVVKAAASSTTPDVNQFLATNYGWGEKDFREKVLKPALLEQKVAVQVAQEKEGEESAFETELAAMRQKPDVIVYIKL